MTTENPDAEYLDRMLRLNPLGDSEQILAERVAYLRDREKLELAPQRSGGSPIDAPRRPNTIATETGLLPPGWLQQRRVVQPPPRSRRRSPGDMLVWWNSMGGWGWIWVAVVLANLLRTILTTNK